METQEFRKCNGSHDVSGSKYQKDRVPVNLFRKNKFGNYSHFCEDCRRCKKSSYQKKKGDHEKFVKEANERLIAENQPFRCCSHMSHKCSKSIYPMAKVPIESFKKEKSNELYKYCFDCRTHKTTTKNKRQTKLKESIILDEEFGVCTDDSHSSHSSPYPANKIPIELFRKVPSDVKSDLLTKCRHCREYYSAYEKQRIKAKKIAAEEKGSFYCNGCRKEKDKNEMATNNDGSNSAICKNCKIKDKERNTKIRDNLTILRLEFINEYQSCCYICNNIYLSDKINNLAKELPTYLINDVRYINYDNKEYTSSEFVKLFNSQLELDILHFDHLTEEEQRKRGLLKSCEIFVPKKCHVSSCKSESAMRLEAHKCQLVCARCHLKETIRREKGSIPNDYATKEKRAFTDELKLSGCENCGYKNSDLPRFFDFDHIDPNTKTMNVSKMVKIFPFTIDDIKIEISKCRILCRHCHMIHTRIQFNNGIIILGAKSKSLKISDLDQYLSNSELENKAQPTGSGRNDEEENEAGLTNLNGTTFSNNNIPPEITEIILGDLRDTIDEIKKKLLKDLIEQLQNDVKMTTEKQRLDPTFFDNKGVLTTIHMGEHIEDNGPLEKLVKSINTLTTDFSKEITTKVLKYCFTEAKYQMKDVTKILDYAGSQELADVCKSLYNTYGVEVLTYPNEYGYTALHRAAQKNDVKASKILISLVDDNWHYINIPGNNMHESPLFVAAVAGSDDVIQILLDTAKERACEYIMNDNNNRHCSLFDSACMNGNLDTVKTLINTVGKENVWKLIHLHNENAFITACCNGKADIATFSLDNVGDRKTELIKEETFGNTGLDYACFNGYLEVVKMITAQMGDRVKELNLRGAISQTHMNKNVKIAEYLAAFFR